MFSSCKSISGKYSIFRKCYFPERKMFSCVWLHFKNFPKNIFWFLEKKKEKTNPEKKSSTIDARLGSTARCFASFSPTTTPSIAIRDRNLASAILRRHDLNLREIAIYGAISRRRDRTARRSTSATIAPLVD